MTTAATPAEPARTAVLVHGLWHGSWSWDAVRAVLDAAGIRSIAVDLPMRSLAGDVRVVRDVLDEAAAGSVLLVGHSYGGAVITAAGEHPAVARLLYLAAFALDEGESISRVAPDADAPATGLAAAMVFSADRSEVSVDPARAPELLYHRAAAAEVATARGRLRPVSRSLFSGRPEQIAWRTRPATYVVCTDDRAVAPQLQRIMAARLDEAIEWDSDHSPNASRPDDVAALIRRLSARG